MPSIALDSGFSAMVAFRSLRMGLFLAHEDNARSRRSEILDVEAEVLNAPRRGQAAPALHQGQVQKVAHERRGLPAAEPSRESLSIFSYRPADAVQGAAKAIAARPPAGGLLDLFA